MDACGASGRIPKRDASGGGVADRLLRGLLHLFTRRIPECPLSSP